jgi:hypothetical protein
MKIRRRLLLVAALTASLLGATSAPSLVVDASPTVWVTHPPLPSATGNLTLTPTSGPPGTVVEAVAVNLKCSIDLVAFTWVGREDVTWSDPVYVDGIVSTSAVPGSFSSGSYEVEATCDRLQSPDEYVRESFTVTPDPTETAAELTLDPPAGPAGSEITATASGHPCDGDVVFLWHDDLDAARAQPDGEGTATARVTVPTDFTPGTHRLLARCEADGFAWPATSFTVTPGPTEVVAVTPPGPHWWEGSGWPALGLMAVLLGGLLTWLRTRRGVRWAHAHVRARPGTTPRVGVEAVETPRHGRSRDISIRIEPHPDSGTHTVREVDP